MNELLKRKKLLESKLEELKTYPGMLLPLLFKALVQREYDEINLTRGAIIMETKYVWDEKTQSYEIEEEQ